MAPSQSEREALGFSGVTLDGEQGAGHQRGEVAQHHGQRGNPGEGAATWGYDGRPVRPCRPSKKVRHSGVWFSHGRW